MSGFETLHVQKQAHDDCIWSVTWSPGGHGEALNRIVSGSLDDTVKTWVWNEHLEDMKENINADTKDISPLELRYIFEGHSLGVVSVDISHDGSNAVTSSLDCNIRFWDLEAGSPVEQTEISASNIDAGPIDSWTVAYSPDSKMIATGNASGKINLYSTETGKLLSKLDTAGKFTLSVSFSPDGTKVASGAADGMIKIFDIEKEKLTQTLEGHALPVRCLSFTPNSDQLISGCDDQQIKIFDLETADSKVASLSGHGSWVLSVDASPNERYFASSSSDRTVKVWDLALKECIHTFNEHTDQVWACKYNHNGKRLVSSADDASIIVYSVS